jgi:hypothetical protein
MMPIVGGQRGCARNIAACFPNRIDTAENHIIDQLCVEMIAMPQRFERRCRKPQCGDFMQSAIRLAASARRAHMVVDKSLRHGILLKKLRRAEPSQHRPPLTNAPAARLSPA